MTQSGTIRISWPFIALGISALVFLSMGAILYVNNRPVHIKMPARNMPKDNAWDDFKRAADMVSKASYKGPMSVTKPSYTDEEYQLFLNDCTPALTVVRGALDKPIMMPVAGPGASSIRKYSGLRDLARTFGGGSAYYERIGQYDRAIESRLDGMEMAIMTTTGADILDELVAISSEAICEHNVHQIIPKLSEAELNHAAKRLEKIAKKRAPFSDVLLQEGYSSAKLWERIINGSPSASNPLLWLKHPPPYSYSGNVSAEEVLGNAKWAFLNKSRVVNSILDHYKKQAQLARHPYTGPSNLKIPQDNLSQALYPIYDGARMAYERAVSRFLLMQIHIALYQYKADHGQFPSRLAQISPTYIKALPNDPFGRGKGFVYKLPNGGNKFLIYSVGPDMHDDGGKPASCTSANPKGDIRLEY